METTLAGWGRGWFTRAHNIPSELRSKICCHCGGIIKWGDEADLKSVPVPFSAHEKCQNHQSQIHLPKETEAQREEPQSTSTRLVDNETFNANMGKSQDFLQSRWYKRVWILFLHLINGEEL